MRFDYEYANATDCIMQYEIHKPIAFNCDWFNANGFDSGIPVDRTTDQNYANKIWDACFWLGRTHFFPAYRAEVDEMSEMHMRKWKQWREICNEMD